VIPPDYGAKLAAGETSSVLVLIDGSDPTIASYVLSAAQLAGQAHGVLVRSQQLALSGAQMAGGAASGPIDVRTRVLYNPDLLGAYNIVPGLIAIILFQTATSLTALAIVRERERGTIEQLIVTPIRSWELVTGKVLPYVILAFVDVIEVLIIGHWWFGVPVRGDLSLVLILSGLFALSSLGIGLFASTIANTQQEAILTVMMTILPSIFLSGFFFPIDAMPRFLQIISYAIPLRYYLVIIRSLLLKGVGASALSNEIIALFIFAVVITGAAAARFRKRLD
jgi:drug efflux transport system permease protein